MPIPQTPAKISKKAQELQDAFSNVLSLSFQDKLEAVCQAVLHEELSPRPGFQQGDEYIWDNALFLNENFKPLISTKHEKLWDAVFKFVKDSIGDDVQGKRDLSNNSMDAWFALKDKHGFVSTWSANDYNKMPPDIETTLFPVEGIRKLSYDSGYSGFGKTGSIDVPENATYLDIWRAADTLIKASGDESHIFIEGIRNIGVLGKVEFVVVTGS